MKRIESRDAMVNKTLGFIRDLPGASSVPPFDGLVRNSLLEHADCDVVAVRIPERELQCSGIPVRVRLLFEPGDERACPLQRQIEIVDAEKQEEPVARCRPLLHQRRMLVRAPLVEAEQDRSVRIEDLTKVGMAGSCLGLAEE